MASLLHVDGAGKPMVSALIERSGLEPADWLRRYFEAYLVPLVHCLYALRTGLHAARRERHPGAGGRRPGQCRHEGHRRGDRGDGRPPGAARGRGADQGRDPGRAKRSWPSSPTSSTASSASSARCWRTTGNSAARTSGALPRPRSGLPGASIRSSRTSLPGTTCSPRTSRCPASTGCSCATTSRCLTWPTRPADCRWSARLQNPLARFA